MAIIAVLYDYDDNTVLQDEVRPKHREFLAAQPNLRLSGPTSAGGAVLVFEGEVAEVEAQLDADPFKAAGVIATRRVIEWNVVLGSWREPLGLG